MMRLICSVPKLMMGIEDERRVGLGLGRKGCVLKGLRRTDRD
jgi:hypothetical protein